MRSAYLIFFIIAANFLHALDVSGRILNEAERPLENAIVSTFRKAAVTDENGIFFLREISSADSITIHKIGYQDQVFSAEMLPSRIILKQAAISIEGVSVFERKTTFKLADTTDKIVIEVEEKSNYQNAAEILSNRADLQLTGTALTGENQSVSLPGLNPRHTLVMLDGIPLNKSGEAFDIASIPAEIIQTIEIGKSNINGSMGIAINIITKQKTGKASVSYKHVFGSFGLDKHSVNLNRTAGNWNTNLFLAKSFSRNDFKYKVPAAWDLPQKYYYRKFNAKEIYDMNLDLRHFNDIVNIEYKLIFQDYFKKLPGTIQNPDFFRNSRTSGQTWWHFIQFSKALKDYNLKADLYFSKEESTYDNTRLDSLYNTPLYRALSTTEQAIRSARIYTEYAQPGFRFDYGADYKHEQFRYNDKLQPDNSISAKFLENYGAFALTKLEREIYPSIWKLAGSARWDRNNRFKDFTSWSISPEYTYQTLFDIILGGSVSNGFTFPSFLSLYWKGDTQTVGNPHLKTEKSLSWQTFGKLDYAGHFFKISYRQDKLEDMIVWFLEFNSKWKPQNIARVEIKTWNFEAEYKLSKSISFNGIYSLVDARNRTRNSDLYGEKIIYTPERKMNVQAKLNTGNWLGTLAWNYAGKQNYTMDQQAEEQYIPAYDLLNASANYNFNLIGLQISVGLRANNIFDKMYEVYRYIPQPGFNWDVNVGVKWTER